MNGFHSISLIILLIQAFILIPTLILKNKEKITNVLVFAYLIITFLTFQELNLYFFVQFTLDSPDNLPLDIVFIVLFICL